MYTVDLQNCSSKEFNGIRLCRNSELCPLKVKSVMEWSTSDTSRGHLQYHLIIVM